jgi:hypothetical protein
MDWKPENWCEIQNAACRQSGVMIRLKIVKTAIEAEALGTTVDESGVLHGSKVLKELIEPWAFTKRMVCADSYFASVGTAEELLKLQTWFNGVVKIATRHFPICNYFLPKSYNEELIVMALYQKMLMVFLTCFLLLGWIMTGDTLLHRGALYLMAHL